MKRRSHHSESFLGLSENRLRTDGNFVVGTKRTCSRRIERLLLGGKADVSQGVFYEYMPQSRAGRRSPDSSRTYRGPGEHCLAPSSAAEQPVDDESDHGHRFREAMAQPVGNAALVEREAATLPLDDALGFELADVGPGAIEVQRQCRRADGRGLSGSRSWNVELMRQMPGP